MQQTFNRMDGLYLYKIFLLINMIMKDQLRRQSAAEIVKLNIEKKSRNKREEGTSNHIFQKKACFMNKTTQTSQATSNTYNTNFNANITKWTEESSREAENIVMRKCRRNFNF